MKFKFLVYFELFTNLLTAQVLSERVRVTLEGFVGIGVTSPTSTIHIAGSIAQNYTFMGFDFNLFK